MAITNDFLEGDPTHLGTLAGVLSSLCSARVKILPKAFTSAGGVAPPSSVTFKAVRAQPRLGKVPWSKIEKPSISDPLEFYPKEGIKNRTLLCYLWSAFLAKTAFFLRRGLTPRLSRVQPQSRHSLITFGAVGKSFFAAHCAPAGPQFCP